MEKKFVIYRGSRMIEGWPGRIVQAQTVTYMILGDRRPDRVRYGKETNGWTAEHPCHDCRVIDGEYHVPGCDVEQCPECGGQLIGCDCDIWFPNEEE